MTKLALLDLVPIVEGGSLSQSMANVPDLAAHAEALGYHRYWIAEHHGMAGIGGAATSLVIQLAGQATHKIRVGSGGIMLPNHAPLQIAEQWGTLDALFPGRVDLGLGRAPGSDGRVAAALRRTLNSDPNGFPRDVMEVMGYFEGDPRFPFEAVPGKGAEVEVWILGSSLYGAELAAMLGLPYGFASHFAPDAMDDAIRLYRERFRPSARLAQPRVLLGFNVFAADTQDEAEYLATSMWQSFAALRTGNPGRLPPPVRDFEASGMLQHFRPATAIGTREVIAEKMEAFLARTQADEVMVSCTMHDHAARKHSIAIAAEAFALVGAVGSKRETA